MPQPCTLDTRYKYVGFYTRGIRRWDDAAFYALTPRLPSYVFALGDSQRLILWRSHERLGEIHGEDPETWVLPMHVLFDYFSHHHCWRDSVVPIGIVPESWHRKHLCCEMPAINAHDFSSFTISEQGMRVFIYPDDAPEHALSDLVEQIGSRCTITPVPIPDAPQGQEQQIPDAYAQYCLDGIMRLRTLLDLITDAESYRRWYPDVKRASHLMSYWSHGATDSELNLQDDDVARLDAIPYLAWYREARLWERDMPQGLHTLYVEQLDRIALYDYQPELGRRFELLARELGERPRKLILQQTQDASRALPCDATARFHLLPADAPWPYWLYLQQGEEQISLRHCNPYPLDDEIIFTP